MGLKFDNTRGVCDWAERVSCVYHSTTNNSDGNTNGGGGGTGTKIIGSATDIDIATSNTMGSSGATANDGSDWGGSWINNVWVPDSEKPQPPGSSPGNSNKNAPTNGDTWDTWSTYITWDPDDIIPYPPHTILASHIPNSAAIASSSAMLPRDYVSSEGWSSQTRGSKTVVGYYAAWQWYDNNDRASPANMKFQKVDRVNFAFFQTDEDGNIWGCDTWADPITLFGPHDWQADKLENAGHAPQFSDDNGFDDSTGLDWNYVGQRYIDVGNNVYCHRATPTGKRDCNGHVGEKGLIGRAHAQGALVYPSIGGWSRSDVFPAMAASAEGRRNFAKNCVGLIREYNFDGIDIDWEFPGYEPHGGGPDDTENFILLLEDIRAALDAYASVTYPGRERTFGLTAALPCGPQIIDHQDVPRVSAALTELNLMTYDFHGTWDDKVGINAPLMDQPEDRFYSPGYSVDGCVERWVEEGADRAKINIGLPFYGRSYGGATELYGDFDGPDGMNWWADQGQPQYYNILEKLPDMISLRDDVTKTQYAYFEKGGIVSFDDSQAICDKVEYAREKQLNGYIIWELSGDLTEDLLTPLLDVVNYKLEHGDGFACEQFRMETGNGAAAVQANAEPNPWYSDWESGTCINDGKQPAWERQDNLFRRKEECCGYKFEYKFDACVGPPTEEPTKKPTREPTLSPIITDPPTLGPTLTFGAAQVVSTKNSRDGVSPQAPETWCLGGCKNANEKCVGNQNHPQNIADSDCRPCQSGQTYWPCDVDGLCFCWDPATPRIPPAPGSGLAQLTEERPCTYFTKATFDMLAPKAQYPYTYEGLCEAIDGYNDGHAEKIFMMGTEHERKSELASFLGHTLHESDEWQASREYLMCGDKKVVGTETYCKPCNSESFDFDNFVCNGAGLVGDGLTFNGYCNRVVEPPAACACEDTLKSESAPLDGYIPASKVFFGRGAIQLSWNYNYRAASEALTGDPMTFCEDPDLVATTPAYAWGAGVFFWMENLKEETTCHIEALRNHDFGGTLNNINGGLECPAYHGGWHGGAIKLRINRYCKASHALGLESILVFEGCKGLNNSFAECLGDGTCPDCQQFSDGVSHTVSHNAVTALTPPTPPIPVATPNPTRKPTSQPMDPTPLSTPSWQIQWDTANPTTKPTRNPTRQPVEAALSENKEEIVTFSCPGELRPVDGLPGCCVPEPAYHGDGACDPDPPYNSPECNFDGGDCCQATCDLSTNYGCSRESSGYGPFGYFCVNPKLDEYIDPQLCVVSDRTRVGDGRCDADIEMYNTEACNWDGGDCCQETCDPTYAHFVCGDLDHPYDCQNPDLVTPISTIAPSRRPVKDPTTSPTLPPVELMESFGSQATVVSVIASEDATIMKGSPDSNHGQEPFLKVKGLSTGPNAHDTIIRFDIPASGLSASTPVDAFLKIYSLTDAQHGGIFHIAPETSPWSERSVTWNSAPDWDTRLGNIGSVKKDQWYTMDVSAAVSSLNGNEGAVTIRIRSRSPQMVKYSSKEGHHPPEIIVAYGLLTSSGMAESKPNPVTPNPTRRLTARPTRRPTMSATVPISSTVASDPSVLVLTPSDDATIVSNRPDQNFGFEETLQVDDDSGVFDSLIRFDLSNIDTRSVKSATLRLYCTDGSDSGGIIGKMGVSSWNEGSVTWSSAPSAFGAPINSLGTVEGATWYEVDVIGLFSGENKNEVSLRITSNSWNRARYSSKEGQEPPELLLEMEDEMVDEMESQPSGICTADLLQCSDGSFVSRDAANDCNFVPCQDPMSSNTGLFFPVWGSDGSIGCVDGIAPSWVTGAYLKESKSACCRAFFMLQTNECLES